jgi:hypothetical protein
MYHRFDRKITRNRISNFCLKVYRQFFYIFLSFAFRTALKDSSEKNGNHAFASLKIFPLTNWVITSNISTTNTFLSFKNLKYYQGRLIYQWLMTRYEIFSFSCLIWPKKRSSFVSFSFLITLSQAINERKIIHRQKQMLLSL